MNLSKKKTLFKGKKKFYLKKYHLALMQKSTDQTLKEHKKQGKM